MSKSTPPTTTTTTNSLPPLTLLQRALGNLSLRPPPPRSSISTLLTTAKRSLAALNALNPTPDTPAPVLHLARSIYEQGALHSIRARDTDAFTSYVNALTPFYALPPSSFDPPGNGQRAKVTGLWLLLLLTRGDFGGFHVLVEGLEAERSVGAAAGEGKGKGGLEEMEFVGYAVRIERWLMEGSYDRVWAATVGKGGEGLGEEFAVFSEVLVPTIRAEIASCSEKAYPSLPIANAKSLLFLESEGAVVDFARERGWVVRDGRIYFPALEGVEGEDGGLVKSGTVIENTIGYARELETIV